MRNLLAGRIWYFAFELCPEVEIDVRPQNEPN